MKSARTIAGALFLLACGVVGVGGGYVATGTGTTASSAGRPFWTLRYLETGARDFRDGRGRTGRVGPRSEYVPTFQLALSYLYPYPGGVQIPVQVNGDDNTPAVVIKINNSTGCFEALKRDGTSAGTWSNDGCTGNVATNVPGQVGRDFGVIGDVTGFPITLTSAYMDSLFQPSSNNTFIFFLKNRPDPGNLYWWTRRSGGTSGHFQIYSDGSGVVRCGYYDLNPVPSTGINSVAFNAWTAIACRKSGTSYTATYQTDDDVTVDATALTAIAGTGGWAIGSRHDGAFQHRGIWVAGLVYDKALTDAQVHEIIDCYEGDCNPGKLLTWRSSQPVGIDHVATTGRVDMMDGATTLVGPNGLIGSAGYRNHIVASGSTSVLGAAGTDRQTPTVTTGVFAGPWSVNLNASECALVVDNDGTNGEGKTGVDMGTDLIDYNLSIYAVTGTSGITTDKVTLGLDAPGGTVTPATCTLTLTATPIRQSCIFRVSGSPSSITPFWFVGASGAQTGSIRICQFQATKGAVVEPPVMTGGVVSPIYYIADATADGWPVASLGSRVEAIHTPGYTSSLWLNVQIYDYRVVDPYVAGPSHAGYLIHNYTSMDTFAAQGLLTPIATTAGVRVASAVEWIPTGGGKCNYFAKFDACGGDDYLTCHATTQVNADTSSTVDCVGTATNANFFARETGSVAGSFTIQAINIYTRR